MAKKLSNATRFKMSNAMHKRLKELNRRKCLSAESDKVAGKYYLQRAYHDNVLDTQSRVKRILTKQEKRFIYDATMKNGGRCIEFLNIK